MDEQVVITEMLTQAGFQESGKSQFSKKDVGTIFIRDWNCEKVFNQIMELGAKHQASKLRELLKISDAVETYIFAPKV